MLRDSGSPRVFPDRSRSARRVPVLGRCSGSGEAALGLSCGTGDGLRVFGLAGASRDCRSLPLERTGDGSRARCELPLRLSRWSSSHGRGVTRLSRGSRLGGLGLRALPEEAEREGPVGAVRGGVGRCGVDREGAAATGCAVRAGADAACGRAAGTGCRGMAGRAYGLAAGTDGWWRDVGMEWDGVRLGTPAGAGGRAVDVGGASSHVGLLSSLGALSSDRYCLMSFTADEDKGQMKSLHLQCPGCCGIFCPEWFAFLRPCRQSWRGRRDL